MKTKAGMDGAGTRLGFGGAVSQGFAVEMALRWRALFLAVLLLPAAALGEQTAREMLKEQQDHRLWEEVGGCRDAERYLMAFPEGLHADEARECPTERRAEEIVLPDGLTLADWAWMAEDRLKAGDHDRLLEEAVAHLREYGPVESVEAVREQAVSGLVAEVRVTTREDAPGALDRIARLESVAGERPELLHLKARAHGLLGDHAAADAAYLQWLRAAPQTHPERRSVLSALARTRTAREKTQRFSELLGRPFSAEWKEKSAGWTDLHYAALLDLPEVVAALCDAGMDVDVMLKTGSPPFGDDLKRTLAAHGHEQFEDWEAGGETPLMIAAVGNARSAAAALAVCGADVNATDYPDRKTPLHLAARHSSLDVAKLLINRGADVDAMDKDDRTPLHYAVRKNSLDVAKLLLDRGADVDAMDKDDRTPLHYAVRKNSLDVAKLLLDRGADVDAMDKDDRTPLHYAVRKNALDVAELLLDRGADVDAMDKDDRTPLHYAALKNSVDGAKLLLDRGADVDAMDKDDRTPLHYAVRKNALDVAELLLDRGADVDAMDKDDRTPLHYAALKNSVDGAKLLLDRGADVDAMDKDDRTPLHYAALKNSVDGAELLLDRGADVDAMDKDGETPLHYAALKNSLGVAELLLDRGADVDARDSDDYTPLHYAALKNSVDVAELLLDRGADVNAKQEYGETPLDFALSKRNREMQAVLRSHGGQCATEC